VEYRRFRQSSEVLEQRLAERQSIHARGWHGEVAQHAPERTLDVSDVTVWDLLTVWSRLQSEVLANRPHRVAGDPRPLRWYVDSIVDRLRADGSFSLRRLVRSGYGEPATRENLVGSFCAILELVKLGVANVDQDEPLGDIAVRLRDDLTVPVEELLAGASFDEVDEARLAEAEAALERAGLDPGDGDPEARPADDGPAGPPPPSEG
jgi:chromatin segregation and condensation protein Rec8/ScpA/Scc1 (kleisin family)